MRQTLGGAGLGAPARSAREGSMARPLARATDRAAALAIAVLFWAGVGLYLAVFSALSLQQYHAYLPHALDLGNMTQALWNTAHGHPFHFLNMRSPIYVEAFGTNTRLSFHVEPIIPFLAMVYACYQHVETLLVMQTVAVASGAIPVRLLARRRLGPGLPELAFPLAYLLFPALEAANLYEFHPVTFAAPLLLWAFYFADGRRYTVFALFALAAMGCKEELGFLVALIGVWIAWRNGDRQFGAVVLVLGVIWSLVAALVIVPHFAARDSSYWGRYLPVGWPEVSYPVTQSEVRHFWLKHPQLVIDNLTSEAKRSYLHRLFYPAGYLSLLSPITLLVALPSLALILLSYESHMYGGLAHYSAELVPIMVVGAILGAEWLAAVVAPRVRVPGCWAVLACSAYVLIAALLNHRVNGFSPLSESYNYPTITAHDRLIDRALALIPPGASVSAQDQLNPHLSDRANIYLYPDTDGLRADYVVIDATQEVGSTIRPCDLSVEVTGDQRGCAMAAAPGTPTSRNAPALLNSNRYNVIFAQDGILVLHRRKPGQLWVHTLPPGFATFARPPAGDTPPYALVARFGPYLELEGYRVDRRETTNLRNPDVVLTTWWRVLKPLPVHAQLVHYLTNPTGALQTYWGDQQATDWYQLSDWRPGQVYKVRSGQLTVLAEHSGRISVDLGLSTNGYQTHDPSYNVPITLIQGNGISLVVGDKKNILRVARIWVNL